MKPGETVLITQTGIVLASRGDVFRLHTDLRIVLIIERLHLHACFVKMMSASSGVKRGTLLWLKVRIDTARKAILR